MLNVQGTIATGDYEGQTYVTQSCLACGGFHLIDPLTGKSPERSKKSRRHDPDSPK
ncbi:MAG: hypothetical protein WCP68_00325 [Enhydrobacter sp.]